MGVAKCFGEEESELKAQGRKELSRYHASDCSFRYKEFADWSVAEQIEFTDQLIRKVFRHPLVIVSYTLDTRDLIAEFQESKGKSPWVGAHTLVKSRC
jgi:hypothetical protein